MSGIYFFKIMKFRLFVKINLIRSLANICCFDFSESKDNTTLNVPDLVLVFPKRYGYFSVAAD